MTVWGWIAIAFLFLFLFPCLLVAYMIFLNLLLRRHPSVRERKPCFPEEPEYVAMYEAGEAWRSANLANKRDVSIESGRLHLVGEYFDFGSDRVVIIVPGRMENGIYSCYFAEPYRQAGYNVLTVDARSTGLSDGRLNCLGYREYRDLLQWTRLMHDSFGNRQVWYHAICIGCFTSLAACTSPDRPDYITGMAAEGMYRNFYITTKNHMIDSHKPLYPFIQFLTLLIRIFCGGSAVFDGPFRRIPDMHLPLLMLHSREDIFSTPDLAQELYDACPSQTKELVWFPKGGHSRVRLNNTAMYDQAVTAFLQRLPDRKEI